MVPRLLAVAAIAALVFGWPAGAYAQSVPTLTPTPTPSAAWCQTYSSVPASSSLNVFNNAIPGLGGSWGLTAHSAVNTSSGWATWSPASWYTSSQEFAIRRVSGSGSYFTWRAGTDLSSSALYSSFGFGTAWVIWPANRTFQINNSSGAFAIEICPPAALTTTPTPTPSSTTTPTPSNTPTPTQTRTAVPTATACEDYDIPARAEGMIKSYDYLSAVSGTLTVEVNNGQVTIPSWPSQLYWFPRASGTYVIHGPGVLRLCTGRVGMTATTTGEPTSTPTPMSYLGRKTPTAPTPMATRTPLPTRTPSATRTPGPTLPATATPTLVATRTPPPTNTAQPTAPRVVYCENVTAADENYGECQVLWEERTQTSLMETAAALPENGTPAPFGTALVAPTQEANMGTAVAALCEREPCASASEVYSGAGRIIEGLAAASSAPACGSIAFPSTGDGWNLDGSGINRSFCALLDWTAGIREWTRIASVLFFAFLLYRYIIATMRRMGDV